MANPYYTPRANTIQPRRRIGAQRDQFGNIGPGARTATPPQGLSTGSLSGGSGGGGGHDWTAFDRFGEMNDRVAAKHAARAAGPRMLPTTQVAQSNGETHTLGGHGVITTYDPTKNAGLQRTVTNNPDGSAGVSMKIDPKYGGGVATATNTTGVHAATGATVMDDGQGGTVSQVQNPYARYESPGMKPREVQQLQSDVASANTDPAAMERMKRREFLAQRQAAPPSAAPTPAPAPVEQTKQQMLAAGLMTGMAAPLMGSGAYSDQDVNAFARPQAAPAQAPTPASAPLTHPGAAPDTGVPLVPMTGMRVYPKLPNVSVGSGGLSLDDAPSFDMSRSPASEAFRRTRQITAR